MRTHGAFFCLILLLAGCVAEEVRPVSGYAKAGDFQVYYEKQGSGEPVLFIHAGLQNHSMWHEQAKELSKTYTVITLDLPYHGSTAGHDTTTLAKDVVKAVLDTLAVDRVSVAGLSMGAAVALDFVIAYPGRVRKAVLISAGINGYEKRYPIDSVSLSWYPKFAAALEANDTAGAALEFAKTWGEGTAAKGDSLQKEASKYVYCTTLETLRKHRLASWPHLENNPPAMERLSQIRLPVLILHGDQDLPFIGTASLYLEKTINGSRRTLVDGVAHMLNLEKPDRVNDILLRFLKN